MTTTPSGPGPEDELHAIASRAIRVSLAIIQVMVAVVLVLAGASITTVRYSLPPRPGTDVLPSATVLWRPGVAAAVTAALVLAASVGWLVWNIRARPRMRWWLLSVAVSVAGVAVVLGVASLPRPTF